MALKKREKILSPTVEVLNKIFPYTAQVPYGFDKPVRYECRKQLGHPYYEFVKPVWSPVINKDAKWHVKNMVLYVRNERDLGLISIAVLRTKK